MNSSEIINSIRNDPDFFGEEADGLYGSHYKRLAEQAASHIEAQDKLIASMASDLEDMASIIERTHDSGDVVDGGDLRYWVQLLRFAKDKAKALSQKDTP